MKRFFEIAYLIVGGLTVLEFIFVQGMFTWLVAVGAVVILGIINVVLEARAQAWMNMMLYALCSTALCMGYFMLPGV